MTGHVLPIDQGTTSSVIVLRATRGTGPNEFARAALQSVCFQTLDLVAVLRVDGGMVASDWTIQRLADILGAPVDRPRCGAAYLAGPQSASTRSYLPVQQSTSVEMTPHAGNGLPFVSGRNNAATRPRM
jgi:glycerol kinase